ncbi:MULTISPECIES: hypothetical protein [Providencia]|nr:hypothetical protein [Providencia rettgeri]
MAKNEFLPFGIAEGANVLSNQEYERLAARFNGFVSGVAKSKELNTVWRQSSVMSSALAQFIVDSDNKDLLDNGDIAGVKNRLVAAIKQTISGVGYVTTSAMNLELNKKMDKANISGVKGNDNDKVPSLNLFTGEIGKLQPKGDYAPAGYSYSKIESDGRYASKQEANDKIPLSSIANSFGSSKTWVMSQDIVTRGLNEKFDKSGGEIAGAVEIKTSGRALRLSSSDKDKAVYFDLFGGDERVAYVGFGSDSTNNFTIHNQKTGQTLRIGDDISANGHRVLTTQDTQIPIGASLLWNTSAPIPDNFWPNEGRSFSASEYPEAAKVMPSLRLPDDRGYAIRTADNGRGKDPGRTVGTYQEDAMRKMTGEFSAGSLTDQAKELKTSGVLYKTNASYRTAQMHDSTTVGGIGLDSSLQMPTADEFRMKNVAKILITRMK